MGGSRLIVPSPPALTVANFRHVGTGGIALDEGTVANIVSHNTIDDTSINGVSISVFADRADPRARSMNNSARPG